MAYVGKVLGIGHNLTQIRSFFRFLERISMFFLTRKKKFWELGIFRGLDLETDKLLKSLKKNVPIYRIL